MVPTRRSAEQWLAEVNEIVRTYRTADPRFPSARQIAMKQLRDLGLTEGDAVRYLGKADVPSDKFRVQQAWRARGSFKFFF